MKNPFVKEKNNALIAGIIIGSVAAAVTTYLFTTEKGAAIREDLGDTFARLHDKVFNKGQQEEHREEDHHQDYLHKPHRAPKTDREALLKDQILTDSGVAQSEE